MTNITFIKCSGCKNIVERDKSMRIRLYPRRRDLRNDGAIMLCCCEDCLKKIGYESEIKKQGEEGLK